MGTAQQMLFQGFILFFIFNMAPEPTAQHLSLNNYKAHSWNILLPILIINLFIAIPMLTDK